MSVCNFLIVSKRCFCMCLLEPKEEVVKWQSLNFLIPANRRVATISLQKVPESVGDGGIFPCLFSYAKPELKHNLEAQPYSEMNP